MEPTSTHITLGIFPFEDLSQEDKLSVFCRAFTSDLATELSKFTQFKIIFFSAQPGGSFLENAGIDYFIKGSFRCDQKYLRINVQLYHSSSMHLVWGNRLEGKLVKLNDIQEQLLMEVIGALQQQINYDLLSPIRKRDKVKFRSYEHWLHGMEELKKGSPENDLAAREHFQKALKEEPGYSLAYLGMSLSYFNEWSCQLWEKWDVSKTGAFEWAQKAIELDDQNYIAAMVLGKILVYEGSFETAEYYLRRSLLLNRNDPDTLSQIASGFTLLGFIDEAKQLYERVLQLDPLNKSRYYLVGSLIYFESGDFKKAAYLAERSTGAKFADTDAYCAAIYYFLDEKEKMELHWNKFLETYRVQHRHLQGSSAKGPVEWLFQINPHRYKSNLELFLEFITSETIDRKKNIVHTLSKEKTGHNLFVRQAVGWELSYDGLTVRVPEVKGFFDIQKLVTHPGQLFHCGELMGNALEQKGEKVFDAKARQQYQQKILDLQKELAEAEKNNDLGRYERLQHEYDLLLDHLSKSLTLKGKVRDSSNPVEKARSAVTWRIRNAIARIEQNHPVLGSHLSNTITTGTFCSYKPEKTVQWLAEESL